MLEKEPGFRSAWLDYVIVGALMLMSGTPVIMGLVREEISYVLTSFFFLTVLLFRKEPPFTARFLVVVPVLSAILVIQCITFNFWPFHTMIGFMLRVFIGYAAVRLVSEFPRRYVRVIYYLCIISFFFHSFTVLRLTTGLDLVQYFKPISKIVNPLWGTNVVVHQFHAYGRTPDYGRMQPLLPFRNCSCFWEPGVFSAYILLAFVFLGLTRDKFDKRQYKRNFAVLVTALFTTISTTGYALLPLSWLFHVRDLSPTRRQLPKLLAFALVVALFYVVAYQLSFVGGKIKKHLDSVAYSEPSWRATRLGTLVYDVEEYISKYPLFGCGLNFQTRYALSSEEDSVHKQGNGLSDFTVKFGLLGVATVLISIWTGVHKLTGRQWKRSALFVFFVVMVLNGERLLNFSVYLGLMFLEPMSKSRQSILGFENSTITGYKRNLSTRF
ncbi:MAG: hypothetical protein HWN69_04700 [Desulfobacterales bacterium]|nr:hypothetical protein [Desulfobacterales bacterium]